MYLPAVVEKEKNPSLSFYRFKFPSLDRRIEIENTFWSNGNGSSKEGLDNQIKNGKRQSLKTYASLLAALYKRFRSSGFYVYLVIT